MLDVQKEDMVWFNDGISDQTLFANLEMDYEAAENLPFVFDINKELGRFRMVLTSGKAVKSWKEFESFTKLSEVMAALIHTFDNGVWKTVGEVKNGDPVIFPEITSNLKEQFELADETVYRWLPSNSVLPVYPTFSMLKQNYPINFLPAQAIMGLRAAVRDCMVKSDPSVDGSLADRNRLQFVTKNHTVKAPFKPSGRKTPGKPKF